MVCPFCVMIPAWPKTSLQYLVRPKMYPQSMKGPIECAKAENSAWGNEIWQRYGIKQSGFNDSSLPFCIRINRKFSLERRQTIVVQQVFMWCHNHALCGVTIGQYWAVGRWKRSSSYAFGRVWSPNPNLFPRQNNTPLRSLWRSNPLSNANAKPDQGVIIKYICFQNRRRRNCSPWSPLCELTSRRYAPTHWCKASVFPLLF